MNTPVLPPSPISPDDDDLQALLSEDSALLKRYRALPDSEPGKHLDAAILGRAANAVRRPAARQRWLIPLASAASVVAAAGIGWRVHLAQQQEQAAAAAPAEKYEVLEIDLQSGDQRRALDTAVMPQQAPANAAGSLGKSAEPEAKERPSLSEIISGPARDNGVTVDPQVFEPHTRSDHAEAGRAPEQRQALSSAPLEDAFSSERAPAAAPAPSRERSEDEALDTVTVTGSRIGDDRRKQTGADAEAFERRKNDKDALPVLTPADWIERIRALIRIRRVGMARDEIRAFREAYPSYQLPRDISRYER